MKQLEIEANQEPTCDNEGCIVYAEKNFCYGNERDCWLYREWERKLINSNKYVNEI